MGIDAEIFFTPDRSLDAQTLRELNWDFIEATGVRGCHDDHQVLREHDSDGYEVPATHRCYLLIRYYGPDYERGSWPTIFSALTWLQRRFPNGQVWYGRDCDSQLELVTPELCESLWAHWAAFGGVPYRRGWAHQGELAPLCCSRPIIINTWCGGEHGGYCPCCDRHWWVKDGKLVQRESVCP